jgi:hypothetical protein
MIMGRVVAGGGVNIRLIAGGGWRSGVDLSSGIGDHCSISSLIVLEKS